MSLTSHSHTSKHKHTTQRRYTERNGEYRRKEVKGLGKRHYQEIQTTSFSLHFGISTLIFDACSLIYDVFIALIPSPYDVCLVDNEKMGRVCVGEVS